MNSNAPADASTNASQEQSANNGQQLQRQFKPIVPQDNTGRVDDVLLGLSLRDMALVAVPPALLFLVLTDGFGLDLSWTIISICIGLGLGLFGLAVKAPYYLKPGELVRRNTAYVRNRIRMPLVDESAWEIPGIRDVFWAWDALAREDDAVFGGVEIGAVPSDQFDDNEQFAYHFGLAMAINSKIEKIDGGFDVQFQFSQFGATPTEFGDLETIAEDEQASLTEYERRFAVERATFGYEYLGESGVMDRSFRVFVDVKEDEGVNVGLIERWVRKLPFAALTDAYRVAQLRLLDERIDQVLGVASYAGGGRRLETDELLQAQREHYRGRDPDDTLDIGALSRGRTVAAPQDVADRAPDTAVDPDRLRTDRSQREWTESENDSEEQIQAKRARQDRRTKAEPIRSGGVPPAGSTDREAVEHRVEHGEQVIEKGRETVANAASYTANGMRAARSKFQFGSTGSKGESDEESDTEGQSDLSALAEAREEMSTKAALIESIGQGLRESVERHTNPDTRRRMYDVYAPIDVTERKNTLYLRDEDGETLEYVCSYMIAHVPTMLAYGTLDPIATLPGVDLDLAVHARATDHREKRDDLDDDRDALVNNAIFKDWFGRADTEDADALATDTIELYEHMREGVEAAEVSITVSIRAPTKQQLRERKQAFKNVCNANRIVYRNPKRQLLAFQTTAPTARDLLHEKSDIPVPYDMPTDALGSLSAFPGYVRQDPGGRILGYAKTDPSDEGQIIDTLQVDRLALTTGHIVSAGRSGSGKTSGENEGLIEERIRNQDWKLVVSDVSEGYDGLAAVHGRRATRLTPPETTINLLEFRPPNPGADSDPGAALTMHVELVASILMTVVKSRGGEDAAELRDTLYDLLNETLYRFGIEPETAHLPIEDRTVPDDRQQVAAEGWYTSEEGDRGADAGTLRQPTMAEFFEVVQFALDNPTEFVLDHEVATDDFIDDVRRLYKHLRSFQEGGQYDFLNGQSEADLSADTVILDKTHYEEAGTVENAVLNTLLTALAYRTAKQTDRTVVVSIDEAHKTFLDEEEAERIAELVRAGRNHGLLFDVLSQATDDFLGGPASIFVDQASVLILHEVGNRDASIAAELGLSPEKEAMVRNRLQTGDKAGSEYAEALVIIEQGREIYLIEKRYSEFVLDVVSYKRSEHGDFDLYLAGIPKDEQDDYAVETDRDGTKRVVRTASARPQSPASPAGPAPTAADGSIEGETVAELPAVEVPQTVSNQAESDD